MLLHTLDVPKASNWNKLWLFKHTPMMREMEKFSYFKKKKTIIYSKLLFFFWKNTKIFPFPSSSACVWTIIICSNLKLLVHPRYVEASQTLKHFIFLEIFLVCLFPINIRDFKPKNAKKKCFLAKNKAKMVGNRQNQKKIRKTDKVKTFV